MNHTVSWFGILLTLIIAFIFTLLPIPDWAIWLRPAWILLVLIFWSTVIPYQFNVGIAWIVGLSVDVLNGTLLGEHALAFAVVVYFASRIHSRFCMFSLVQQGLIVWLLVLLSQFVLFCIQGFIGDFPRTWLYWSSSFVSMLLWPWVFVIMHDCRRRFRVS